jgi:hypothetical protein
MSKSRLIVLSKSDIFWTWHQGPPAMREGTTKSKRRTAEKPPRHIAPGGFWRMSNLFAFLLVSVPSGALLSYLSA